MPSHAHIFNKNERLIIGIMSGTSLDGIDLACVHLQGSGQQLKFTLRHFVCYPMPETLRHQIRNCFSGTTEAVCRLHYDLGRFIADLILQFCHEQQLNLADIDAVGWHGQTVFHCHGHSTLQIGEADCIAKKTGLIVIHDFRAADIAVGGCGAPLVPYFDRLIFATEKKALALQNLGGIGNVTYLPADPEDPIVAFDTGPANVILNELVEIYTDGRHHYDQDGFFSQSGRLRENLLHDWLTHPFFSQPLPKSTGREDFGQAYTRKMIAAHSDIPLPDLIRTTVSLTTHSVYQAYQRYLPDIDKIYLSGGGAHHPLIWQEMGELFGRDRVDLLSNRLTIPIDAKEAVAFAVFAHERLNGTPTNVPSVTGAQANVCLGKIALP